MSIVRESRPLTKVCAYCSSVYTDSSTIAIRCITKLSSESELLFEKLLSLVRVWAYSSNARTDVN